MLNPERAAKLFRLTGAFGVRIEATAELCLKDAARPIRPYS